MGAGNQRQQIEAATQPKRRNIAIEAKSKLFNFNIRLQLANLLPYSSVLGRGFSFVLNCHFFRLRLQSDSDPSETIKSKFKRYVGKIFKSPKSSGKTLQRLPSIKPKCRKKPSTASNAIVSVDSFISRVIPDDTQGGIVMLSSLFLFMMKFLFNRIAAGRRLSVLLVLIAVSSYTASSSSTWLCEAAIAWTSGSGMGLLEQPRYQFV